MNRRQAWDEVANERLVGVDTLPAFITDPGSRGFKFTQLRHDGWMGICLVDGITAPFSGGMTTYVIRANAR
jgi:hypothetical protein